MSFRLSINVTCGEETYVDINFPVYQTTALVGQSGSGKSLTLKAILGLLPNNFYSNIQSDAPFSLTRGENIGFVPQNPFTALNPFKKVGAQFFTSREVAEQLCEDVGLELSLLNRFPSELSGGQIQRAVIAMVLAANPSLLLLDEPTTALDEETKKSLLILLGMLQKNKGVKIIIVSHDLRSLGTFSDYTVILANGKCVEQGVTADIIASPSHSFTKKLIESDFSRREFRQ